MHVGVQADGLIKQNRDLIKENEDLQRQLKESREVCDKIAFSKGINEPENRSQENVLRKLQHEKFLEDSLNELCLGRQRLREENQKLRLQVDALKSQLYEKKMNSVDAKPKRKVGRPKKGTH